MEWLSKAGSLIERVRTPLALAGLVVMVLYALYKQILQMNIFAGLDQGSTYLLINRILFYLFILAILAIILGGIGYFISSRSARPKS